MRHPCPYCDPYTVPVHHLSERVDKLFLPFQKGGAALDRALQRIPGVHTRLYRWVMGSLFWVFERAGVLRETPLSQKTPDVSGRIRAVAQSAQKRAVSVGVLRCFGRATQFLTLRTTGGRIVAEGVPCYNIVDPHPPLPDDKQHFRETLHRHGLPAPEGRAFYRTSAAFSYGVSLGFPVAVKPRDGSLSKHTTGRVETRGELQQAVKAAKIIAPSVIVERHVPGSVYRATLVNNRLIACCRRDPPHIVGDGASSVSDLLRAKNKKRHSEGRTEIPLTRAAAELLRKRNLSLESVPSAGERVTLHSKVVTAAGAEMHDVTDEIHPANIRLCEDVAALFNLPLIGLDLIMPDTSVSWRTQPSAVIEANSLPYIDMHHWPDSGIPRDVAGVILDEVF